MRRWWIGLLVACAGAAQAAEPGFPLTLRDDGGQVVTLRAPARRIVTIAPNLTEIVAELGALDRVVGTVNTSNFPPEAARIPRIGDHQRLDLERIIGLKPDLVLVWTHSGTDRELAMLRKAGLQAFRVEPLRLAELPPAIERVGQLLGLVDTGRQRARALRDTLAALRDARPPQAPRVDVFYQVWSEPLMTLSGRHIVSDVIELCGGRNVFAALQPLAPQVSIESVLQARPEAILSAREDGGGPLLERVPADADFALWRRLGSGFTPTRRGWLYTLPGDEISRAGPRIAIGARAVCQALDEVRAERAARP